MKKEKEEEKCCFTCRSFSPHKGRKGIGYCMKLRTGRKPKDICGMHRG